MNSVESRAHSIILLWEHWYSVRSLFASAKRRMATIGFMLLFRLEGYLNGWNL